MGHFFVDCILTGLIDRPVTGVKACLGQQKSQDLTGEIWGLMKWATAQPILLVKQCARSTVVVVCLLVPKQGSYMSPKLLLPGFHSS